MTKGCPGANPSLVLVAGVNGPPWLVAGDARARPWRLSGPLDGGRKPKRGPLVGVDAPEFGPGVGLNAMGLMSALPCKGVKNMINLKTIQLRA